MKPRTKLRDEDYDPEGKPSVFNISGQGAIGIGLAALVLIASCIHGCSRDKRQEPQPPRIEGTFVYPRPLLTSFNPYSSDIPRTNRGRIYS